MLVKSLKFVYIMYWICITFKPNDPKFDSCTLLFIFWSWTNYFTLLNFDSLYYQYSTHLIIRKTKSDDLIVSQSQETRVKVDSCFSHMRFCEWFCFSWWLQSMQWLPENRNRPLLFVMNDFIKNKCSISWNICTFLDLSEKNLQPLVFLGMMSCGML